MALVKATSTKASRLKPFPRFYMVAGGNQLLQVVPDPHTRVHKNK